MTVSWAWSINLTNGVGRGITFWVIRHEDLFIGGFKNADGNPLPIFDKIGAAGTSFSWSGAYGLF